MSTVVVTGGAGYVGSHAVKALAEAGDDVVVFDDLSAGHAEAIDRIARLVKDTRDTHLIEKDARGRTINALTAIGVIGGCTDTNEVNYLLVKAFRAGLGVIPVEQQARI